MKIWDKVTHYPKIGLVILAYGAFIALGMPDGLLGVAWPSIRTSFSIPLDAIGLLITAAIAGYLTSSFLSGPLIARWGVDRVLAASCAMTGAGLIGFSIAPIFPALMSDTSQRVGAHFAANTIGMQMAPSGLGTAVIPRLLGVLARQLSLEVVPICLMVVFLGLFGLYRMSMMSRMIYRENTL